MSIHRDLNALAGAILLGGLLLSTLLILAGLAGEWLATGTIGSLPALSAHNLREYLVYVLQLGTQEGGGPAALVNGGIAILLLTPFTHILASMLFFWFYERNRVFAAITGFVLVVLGVVLFIS